MRHTSFLRPAAAAHSGSTREKPSSGPAAPWTVIVSATTPTTPDMNVLLQQARAEPFAPDGNYAYTKLTGGTIPPFVPPHRIEGRFGEVLELQGFDIKGKLRGGETLHLQLYCQASAAAHRELRIFVHLEAADGRIIAQDDALGYDAREWQPGDRFIGVHDLKLPDDLPAAPSRLIVGLYDVVTGERYPVGGAQGRGDYIEIPLSTLNEA